jgi:uncharacterized protein YeaO (DUF488 family)
LKYYQKPLHGADSKWRLEMIKLKRAYEKLAKDDGELILVERLWPRGLARELAKLDLWLKDIAPN